MAGAQEVQERLERVTAILNQSGLPYAVIGGNAVASWVASKDKGSVRFTKAVDILLRRQDLDAAKAVLTEKGFVYNETLDVHMFLEGPDARPSEAVHLLFAEEKVKPDDLVPAPPITDSEDREQMKVLKLESLVRMKLTSFRRKDQVHVLDMIGVGLIDATWPARFPPELGARLQELLDDPNG